MAGQEIKLPLLCKAIHLAAVPHQPGERYGVCWGGMREPSDGLGYLIEFTGKRTGRVIGWLRDGGYVYACDNLIDQVPEGRPALSLALWRNKRDAGRITVTDVTGQDARQVSEFTVSDLGYTFVDPVTDLGATYSTGRCQFKELLAVAYLAFVYIPRVQGGPSAVGRTLADVLDELLKLPPADAIDALIAEVDRAGRTSGFERYAARILRDADPAAFRAVVTRHHVTWHRLTATGLFWISCPMSELDEGEANEVIAIEGALNRLALIERAARESGSDALAAMSEARCADEDWREMRSIARQAAKLLAGSSDENPMLSVLGTRGERGGEWDVRSRIARTLETLVLPFRLIYRFAVNVAAGTVVVACMVPPAQAMPRWRRGAVDAATGAVALERCDARAPEAASAYAVRLVATLAEAAFGASAGISQVQVRCCADVALREPVLCADIDRTAFVTEIHERVCADDFAEPALATSFSGLIRLLEPAQLTYHLDKRLGLTALGCPEDEAFDPDAARTLPFWQDDRALPAGLATLLRADTVRELDVFHVGEDPFEERVRAAAVLARENPTEAAQQVADLLDMMALMDDVNGISDDAEASEGDAANPRPLYCSNYLARFAISFVEPNAAVRFRNVLDSTYDALVLLARLCTDNDDASHGLAYARRAIDLGPTSPQAYIAAATACMELGQPDQAVELLKQALRFDASPASYTYTYYRLAFALWHAGEPRAGLACYEHALANPRLRDTIADEVRALRAETGLNERMSAGEVTAVLERAGVPDAPTDELVELAARILVRATDAGLLNVANVVARVVSNVMRDDAFTAATTSLLSWIPQQS